MDDTAERIRKAILEPINHAINDGVAPVVQLEVEDGLGVLRDAIDHTRGLGAVDSVADAVQATVGAHAAPVDATAGDTALGESVARAILADPRVQEAIRALAAAVKEAVRRRWNCRRQPTAIPRSLFSGARGGASLPLAR